MDNTTEKKHYKSFWPIAIIIILSFFAGGSVMWVVFNSNMQENLNSIFPSYNARMHKKIEQGNAEQFKQSQEEQPAIEAEESVK